METKAYFGALLLNKQADVRLRSEERRLDRQVKVMYRDVWKQKELLMDDYILINVRTPSPKKTAADVAQMASTRRPGTKSADVIALRVSTANRSASQRLANRPKRASSSTKHDSKRHTTTLLNDRTAPLQATVAKSDLLHHPNTLKNDQPEHEYMATAESDRQAPQNATTAQSDHSTNPTKSAFVTSDSAKSLTTTAKIKSLYRAVNRDLEQSVVAGSVSCTKLTITAKKGSAGAKATKYVTTASTENLTQNETRTSFTNVSKSALKVPDDNVTKSAPYANLSKSASKFPDDSVTKSAATDATAVSTKVQGTLSESVDETAAEATTSKTVKNGISTGQLESGSTRNRPFSPGANVDSTIPSAKPESKLVKRVTSFSVNGVQRLTDMNSTLSSKRGLKSQSIRKTNHEVKQKHQDSVEPETNETDSDIDSNSMKEAVGITVIHRESITESSTERKTTETSTTNVKTRPSSIFQSNSAKCSNTSTKPANTTKNNLPTTSNGDGFLGVHQAGGLVSSKSPQDNIDGDGSSSQNSTFRETQSSSVKAQYDSASTQASCVSTQATGPGASMPRSKSSSAILDFSNLARSSTRYSAAICTCETILNCGDAHLQCRIHSSEISSKGTAKDRTTAHALSARNKPRPQTQSQRSSRRVRARPLSAGSSSVSVSHGASKDYCADDHRPSTLDRIKQFISSLNSGSLGSLSSDASSKTIGRASLYGDQKRAGDSDSDYLEAVASANRTKGFTKDINHRWQRNDHDHNHHQQQQQQQKAQNDKTNFQQSHNLNQQHFHYQDQRHNVQQQQTQLQQQHYRQHNEQEQQQQPQHKRQQQQPQNLQQQKQHQLQSQYKEHDLQQERRQSSYLEEHSKQQEQEQKQHHQQQPTSAHTSSKTKHPKRHQPTSSSHSEEHPQQQQEQQQQQQQQQEEHPTSAAHTSTKTKHPKHQQQRPRHPRQRNLTLDPKLVLPLTAKRYRCQSMATIVPVITVQGRQATLYPNAEAKAGRVVSLDRRSRGWIARSSSILAYLERNNIKNQQRRKAATSAYSTATPLTTASEDLPQTATSAPSSSSVTQVPFVTSHDYSDDAKVDDNRFSFDVSGVSKNREAWGLTSQLDEKESGEREFQYQKSGEPREENSNKQSAPSPKKMTSYITTTDSHDVNDPDDYDDDDDDDLCLVPQTICADPEIAELLRPKTKAPACAIPTWQKRLIEPRGLKVNGRNRRIVPAGNPFAKPRKPMRAEVSPFQKR